MSILGISIKDLSNQQTRTIREEFQEHQKIEDAFLTILDQVLDEMAQEPKRSFKACLLKVAAAQPQDQETELVCEIAKQFHTALVANRENEPAPNSFERWSAQVFLAGKIFWDSHVVDIKPIAVPESIKRDLFVRPSELSCFEYALCQINEKKVLEGFRNEELPDLLNKWGYISTASPNPGDLVLYADDETPTHLGVYRGKGMVESKWGNLSPVAYVHKTEDAPIEYGDKVVFFRPPKKTPAIEDRFDSLSISKDFFDE